MANGWMIWKEQTLANGDVEHHLNIDNIVDVVSYGTLDESRCQILTVSGITYSFKGDAAVKVFELWFKLVNYNSSYESLDQPLPLRTNVNDCLEFDSGQYDSTDEQTQNFIDHFPA